MIESFIVWLETQFSTGMKTFQLGNAKEYMSQLVEEFLQKRRIVLKTFCVYILSQSGVADGKNGYHIFQRLLLHLCFKHKFQKNVGGEAMLISAYLTNPMPSRVFHGKTSWSLLTTKRYPLALCDCFIHNHKNKVEKIDLRDIKEVLLGYSIIQKEYKCLILVW